MFKLLSNIFRNICCFVIFELDFLHKVFENYSHFRLSSETLAEVEQKDIYVRLQEIFRDRKVALDQSLANIEQHYEHISQVDMLKLKKE